MLTSLKEKGWTNGFKSQLKVYSI